MENKEQKILTLEELEILVDAKLKEILTQIAAVVTGKDVENLIIGLATTLSLLTSKDTVIRKQREAKFQEDLTELIDLNASDFFSEIAELIFTHKNSIANGSQEEFTKFYTAASLKTLQSYTVSLNTIRDLTHSAIYGGGN